MKLKNKKEIFLVDDHPIVCEGLEQLINQEDDLHVCGHAYDAATAMKAIRFLKPDLVVVDVSLKGKSGIELMSEIKVYFPGIYILALSMHSQLLIVDRAMKAGAMGYVNKDEATNVIVHSIRRVLGGMIYLSSEMSERLLDNLYGKKVECSRILVETLSQREFEIFRLIGQRLRARDISKTLNISIKTVYAHQESIKEKLFLKNSRDLYTYALQWLTLSN
jgi:DNA-binding NarL/FixJ family response regulator